MSSSAIRSTALGLIVIGLFSVAYSYGAGCQFRKCKQIQGLKAEAGNCWEYSKLTAYKVYANPEGPGGEDEGCPQETYRRNTSCQYCSPLCAGRPSEATVMYCVYEDDMARKWCKLHESDTPDAGECGE